jgi:hypothetical protein
LGLFGIVLHAEILVKTLETQNLFYFYAKMKERKIFESFFKSFDLVTVVFIYCQVVVVA